MKGVNGVKKVVEKLKFKTIYKNRDIHIIPEDGKYDGCYIWLHNLGDTAEAWMPLFREKELLGVLIFLYHM